MKRIMFLLTAILALGLVFGGCKKEQKAAPAEPATTEEPKAAEPEPEEPKAAEPKEEAKPEEKKEEAAAVTGDPEKDCGALHDMMKQMIEALQAKLGKGAKPKREFPPRAKFVEACKMLPPEVVRCMNPKVSIKEHEKCRAVMMNANKEKMARFKAILSRK